MNLIEFRNKYPQYDNVDDETLTNRLYQKYYADKMSYEQFAENIRYKPTYTSKTEAMRLEQKKGPAQGLLERIGRNLLYRAKQILPEKQIQIPDELAIAHEPIIPPPTQMMPAHEPYKPEPEYLMGMEDINLGMLRPEVAEPSPEAWLHLHSLAPALTIGGLGALAELTKIPAEPGRLERAQKQIEKFTEGLTYQPRTEKGKLAAEGLRLPFEALFKLGDMAGAKVLKETGSPVLAALAATTVEAAPILVPLIGKKAKPIQRIKSSTWWRMKTEPERAVVTNRVAKWYREGMSEGEILRRLDRESETYQKAVETRRAPEGFKEAAEFEKGMEAEAKAAEEFKATEIAPFKMPEVRKAPVAQIPEVLPKPEVSTFVEKPEIKKYRKPAVKKFKEAKTLSGAIRQMGGINFLHFKGEYKELAPAAKFLKRKTGAMPIDIIENALKDEGWLRRDENLLEVLRDPSRIRQGKVTAEILEKKPAELTEQEKELKTQMEREPEEPPKGEYITIKAEDLPEGKNLTLIEGKSREGWDIYRVEEKDPFEIKLVDGETITLKPLDEVQVLKSEVEKPKLELKGEKETAVSVAQLKRKGREIPKAKQETLTTAFEQAKDKRVKGLRLEGEQVSPKEKAGFEIQKEKLKPTKYKGIEIEVEAIREKTGEKIKIKQDAQKALDKIDSDINKLNKFLECLKGVG